MSELELQTASAEETEALAAEIAEGLVGGEVILLTGGIGSGKTVFAKGVARGLGIEEIVVSPSFLLQRTYEGRLELDHFDLYRLTEASEVDELGIDEFADAGAVVVVEWADRFEDPLAPPFLRVAMDLGEGEDDRRLVLTPVGGDWEERLAPIAERLEAEAAAAGAEGAEGGDGA
ncbi:MAG TPA: tRNA (adenosine(37)-N6)-threonylcarbamoyltransferase complex ATPase subunit type 1 TsaE [Capillimicrobium sp.]